MICAPKIIAETLKVSVGNVSTESDSGWRGADARRVEELIEMFVRGDFGLVSAKPSVLMQSTDNKPVLAGDGLIKLADGKHTFAALKEVQLRITEDQQKPEEERHTWSAMLLDALTNGVEVKGVEFAEQEYVQAFNVWAHDVDNNTCRPTSMQSMVETVRRLMRKIAGTGKRTFVVASRRKRLWRGRQHGHQGEARKLPRRGRRQAAKARAAALAPGDGGEAADGRVAEQNEAVDPESIVIGGDLAPGVDDADPLLKVVEARVDAALWKIFDHENLEALERSLADQMVQGQKFIILIDATTSTSPLKITNNFVDMVGRLLPKLPSKLVRVVVVAGKRLNLLSAAANRITAFAPNLQGFTVPLTRSEGEQRPKTRISYVQLAVASELIGARGVPNSIHFRRRARGEHTSVMMCAERQCPLPRTKTFGSGKDFFKQLLAGVAPQESIAHVVLLSTRAHPAPVLAAHEAGAVVHVLLDRGVPQHSRYHDQLLLKEVLSSTFLEEERAKASPQRKSDSSMALQLCASCQWMLQTSNPSSSRRCRLTLVQVIGGHATTLGQRRTF